MNRLVSYFSPIMPQRFVYMLQIVEYNPRKFMNWVSRLPNLFSVMRRGQLKYTRKARALLLVAYGTSALCLATAALLALRLLWLYALFTVLVAPVLTAIILSLIVKVGYAALNIKRKPLLAQASSILEKHPAIKIAILGSYGKTTMKELLVTILSEGKRVKATPGNMNVPISHARWITSRVSGEEEVLIFEYGEGEPGDIARFARLTHPDRAIITGIAPNHLDHYPSLDALAEDLLSIRQFVPDDQLMMNEDAKQLREKAPNVPVFGQNGFLGWTIENVKVNYDGTSFEMKKDDIYLRLHSGLIGRHQVGPLAATAALAHDLGLSPKQIEEGIVRTTSFNHRLQARQVNGAWVIDDTYNGNLEGIRAGLRLMQDLPAKRKIYVTPGLVDQGVETQRVHQEIGELIAKANPDKVVLMKNSVTSYIKTGLETKSYSGELVIEGDPLSYYNNLGHHLAGGDLVVLQNDWPDNYS